MITSKFTVREQNASTILRSIIIHREISRAELSVITGLNKASVSEISKQLLESSLILETGTGSPSQAGGRKPIMLTFNGNAGLVIGMDLGPNYIEAILTNLSGEAIQVHRIKNLKTNKKNILSSIQKVLAPLLEQAPSTPHGIVGLTLAVHGVVNQQKISFTPAYDLDEIDLVNQLSGLYTFPIFIENEANLAALGEYCFGTASENMICISSHSGIGAGIVRGGALYSGSRGLSGEIGHMTLYPNGIKCPCGNKGCLELYTSNQAIYHKVETSLSIEQVDSDILSQLSSSHPIELIPIFEEFTNNMAIGIHNTILLSDPEIVILNNSIYRKLPMLLEKTKQKLNSRFSETVEIRNSSLKGDAILYGGVAYATQQYLGIQGLKFIKNEK